MTTTLKTTALGDIRGRNDNGVVQYLGIQYATLKDRLADAELISGRPADAGVLDATKDGPTAPSPFAGCEIEQAAIQHTLPKKDLAQSDLDCLNLNIAVPEGTTARSKLPVYLFIHGGGFALGAISWPQFDWAKLVGLSKEMGYPILAVAMNYRLGALGFLTSRELRDAGYKPNRGFRDQKVAIRWVKKHIRDFGGNPDNITLAGMSVGGACVTQHLHSDEVLFKRAIVMSGTNLLMPLLPLEAHEHFFQMAINAWGMGNLSLDARIKALLETPAQELITKLPPSVPIALALDGDLIPSPPTFAEIMDKNSLYPKGKAWCQEILIGDAQIDASVFAFLHPTLKKNIAARFFSALNQALPEQSDIAKELAQKYGIVDGAPDDEAFPHVLEFINDIGFAAPAVAYTRGWPGTVYRYFFNEENPWDGPWKGRASHILDLAYLYQNYNDFLSEDEKAVAKMLAEDFFKFCYGHPPWQAIDDQTGFAARVYGPSSKNRIADTTMEAFGEESQRRGILFEFADRISLDALAKVFPMIMAS